MSTPVETVALITRTPGICGGDACVHGTRIMVSLLISARRQGQSDADLLAGYPTLTAAGLDAAWDYYRRNPVKIEQAIWLNTTPLDHPPGSPVPPADLVYARLLGLSDEEIREA